jgi:hypothetical protein
MTLYYYERKEMEGTPVNVKIPRELLGNLCTGSWELSVWIDIEELAFVEDVASYISTYLSDDMLLSSYKNNEWYILRAKLNAHQLINAIKLADDIQNAGGTLSVWTFEQDEKEFEYYPHEYDYYFYGFENFYELYCKVVGKVIPKNVLVE